MGKKSKKQNLQTKHFTQTDKSKVDLSLLTDEYYVVNTKFN